MTVAATPARFVIGGEGYLGSCGDGLRKVGRQTSYLAATVITSTAEAAPGGGDLSSADGKDTLYSQYQRRGTASAKTASLRLAVERE